ncbi:S-methyl-5'-thioadenosine phosphorylase [Candidatus Parcubacteria bacterium]|nr:MAG: S-methyl-5'-thioadenosine phosphorylase [Candidatus Parcubacteria bacterium]
MSSIKIGIIGGSGLDDPKLLNDFKEKEVQTKWGKPSSIMTTGKLADAEICILSRHGKEHKITPTGVNYRANIQSLKDAGCTHILATSACGSLREEIKRGDFIILDQFIDFTRHRNVTFYDEFPGGADNAKHTGMADPFNEDLRRALIKTCEELNLSHHKKGCVVTIEGARFSTRAESDMFRLWGADVINMSIAPEVILANEAGIPYAAVAMSTDYDCWKTDEEAVTWPEILKIFNQNVDNVKKLLINTVPKISQIKKEVEVK